MKEKLLALSMRQKGVDESHCIKVHVHRLVLTAVLSASTIRFQLIVFSNSVCKNVSVSVHNLNFKFLKNYFTNQVENQF
jgi:hypothetical protein